MAINLLSHTFDKREKTIKHYKSSHKILLVGEGNFSFSVCLANAFGNATNMVATPLDSEASLLGKYGGAKRNLQELKDKNCTILHNVDAHKLSEHDVLQNQYFDRIIFNFPHAGVLWHREHNQFQIQLHQELIRGFLASTKKLLTFMGEIHITHKTTYPFDRWNIVELAEAAGLGLVAEVGFNKWDYPGYINKKGEGHGSRCDDSFPVGACSTYMFCTRYY